MDYTRPFRSFMPNLELDTLEERFMAAVWDGDDEEAKHLLSDDRLDINGKISRATSRHINSTTAMHMAIQRAFNSVVRLILKRHDYRIAETNNYNETALHIAANYDENGFLARALLAHRGAETIVNVKAHYLETALHRACRKNNVVMVRELLKVAQIETSPFSEGIATPMMMAVANYDVAIVEELLEHGVDCNLGKENLFPHNRPLAVAVELNRTSAIELLLNNGAATTHTATLDLILNSEPIHQMEPTEFECRNMVTQYIEFHLLSAPLPEKNIKVAERLLEACPHPAEQDMLFELYHRWFKSNLPINAALRRTQKDILCRIIYKSLGMSVDERLQIYLMNEYKLTENEDFRLLIPYRSKSLMLLGSIKAREQIFREYEAGTVKQALHLGRKNLENLLGLSAVDTLHLDWRIDYYINEITSKGLDFYSLFE